MAELDKLVEGPDTDLATRRAVLGELKHRSTNRAAILRRRLEREIDATLPNASRHSDRDTEIAGSAINGKSVRSTPPAPPAEPASSLPDRVQPLASPPLSDNDPVNIMRAWTVLEVLSPATFRKPADLAGGDMRRIARFDRGLPWADGPAKGPPGARLYFQIVLGSLSMQPAIDQLLARFGDARAERPQARGETPLCVVIVDREGRPIPDTCAFVSSFCWGFPLALSGDPASLAQWTDAEASIQSALHKRLFREVSDGKPMPLDVRALHNAFDWLTGEFCLDRAMLTPPSFAVRSPIPFKSTGPPEPIILNSFYLKDLALAADLFREGNAPDTLKRYVGNLLPVERRDILHDETVIEDAVAPAKFPLGRWPGPGRHPLVLMQQAAVNLALGQKSGEILAVNGPPGTGKTTLLRDVVAGLVTARAAAMALFDDPEKAFTNSGERLNLGGAWIHLYRLDPRLKGFEMLVASSNNKAVENVSRELPAIGAIADDAANLRYFKPISDALLGAESWGSIAAVLGNGANRHAFKSRFWWDEDTGLFAYLKAVDGRRPEVDLPGGSKRPPRIVTELRPPLDRREALSRWQRCRRRFQELAQAADETRQNLERLRLRNRLLPTLDKAFRAASEHGEMRPGLLYRMFGLARYRGWRRTHLPLSAAFAEAIREAEAGKVLPVNRALRLSKSPWFGFGAAKSASAFESALRPLIDALDWDRVARPSPIVDNAFFATGSGRFQQSAPWFTVEEHRQRDALFEAALDLHRAFIDAAAKPLRHNLGAAMQVIDGRGFADSAKNALIPDLWSSLFLAVPTLSTTFASVHTMLGRLPGADIGWLLIDEAGQASPQQAVGAIMRANRVIIVGDPIQVPPVVLLPDKLTAAICHAFGVDHTRFSAPTASAQTLADDANGWFAEFGSRMSSRIVGVPLLVHRRCSAPMFDIANRVAYENLMVQAKLPRPSPIRDLLGPSRWFDVAGSGIDKWSPAEGAVVLDLLERIVRARLHPDIYVVTPFVQVADGLRRTIRASAALADAIPDLDRWTYERIGTIHTVQGREAEAVIFVLGATDASQTGARVWAGREPNLLNVAVTRAKEVLYVVGNRDLWRSAGVFDKLAAALPD